MPSRNLEFEVKDFPPTGAIAEMSLWQPPQGSEWHSIPLLVDLTFGSETVSFPDFCVEVTARKALIHVKTYGCDICRGTKYGGDVLSPYVVAEIQEEISQTIEREAIADFSGGFEVKRGLWGAIVARWRKTRRSKKQKDEALRVETRLSRVAPTTKDRWVVAEPLGSGILSGMYLGEITGSKNDPLCLLTMNAPNASVDLTLTIDTSGLHLEIHGSSPFKSISKNKAAVVGALVRRSVPSQLINTQIQPVNNLSGKLIFGFSQLKMLTSNE